MQEKQQRARLDEEQRLKSEQQKERAAWREQRKKRLREEQQKADSDERKRKEEMHRLELEDGSDELAQIDLTTDTEDSSYTCAHTPMQPFSGANCVPEHVSASRDPSTAWWCHSAGAVPASTRISARLNTREFDVTCTRRLSVSRFVCAV